MTTIDTKQSQVNSLCDVAVRYVQEVNRIADSISRYPKEAIRDEEATLPAEIVRIDANLSVDFQPILRLGNIPIYPGETIVLSGMPGSGKSTWILTHMPENSLLLETDFDAKVAAWLREKLSIRTSFEFAYVAANPARFIATLQSIEARNPPPVAIFVDTIQGVSSDPDALDSVVQYVRDFATRTGIPTIVASHENRREANPLERIQGTLRLAQEATLVLRITGSHRGPRKVHVLKDRYAVARDLPPAWEWGPRPNNPSPGTGGGPSPKSDGPDPGAGDGRALSPRAKEILALLRACGSMSAADIARALGYSRQHAQRLLKELQDAGEVQVASPGGRGRGHATLYAAKMHISRGYVHFGESTPQESASDLENVPNVHFTSASEAESRPKMHMGSENAHGADVHFSASTHADLRPKMHMAGMYSMSVSETETDKGQVRSGVCVSGGESKPYTRLPGEADEDLNVWPFWTFSTPRARKDTVPPSEGHGACPFHDCPYHTPLPPKDPWSWLL